MARGERGLAVSVAWLALAGVLGGGTDGRVVVAYALFALVAHACFFMLQSALARNHITYNATMSACEKGEQCQQALELFERTLGEGVQQNTITYSAAITACEKSGQWRSIHGASSRSYCSCAKGRSADAFPCAQ